MRAALRAKCLVGALACVLVACADQAPAGTDSSEVVASDVYLSVGNDVDPAVKARLTDLLGKALGHPVHEGVPADAGEGALVLSIGDTPLTHAIVPRPTTTEAIAVKSEKRGGATFIAADGAPGKHGNLGAHHAAYAMLESLGFAFLHPLAPTIPHGVRMPSAAIDLHVTPRWAERRIHLHTQHPLELTELLQGFGEDLSEWDRFLEWAVANGENGVEWFLLWAKSFEAYADSEDRIEHLKKLVDHAHAYGIEAGIDAPIAFAQQHSFRLLRQQGELADELREIDTRLDWLDRAGWDFYGIEPGTSEFTSPDPARMLAWMNEVAKNLDEKHGGKRAFMKIHCSQGQAAEGFSDPVTGAPLNINELPHYADPRLGILPHTVEHYGLTDPAPTYGNENFHRMREFLHQEAGSRPVLFYPETAYWVSFDVDVPLFLPLYADRRMADLRLLAKDEAAGANKMDGQLVFSSGWEWGYWLNDVIAARSAFTTDTSFSSALGGVFPADVTTWIRDVVTAEQALLIEGKVNGRAPADIHMRNGQGYLQGWDTWDDVGKLLGSASPMPLTQPDRLGLVDMRNPLHGGPNYAEEIAPLLAEMETRFGDLASRGDALRAAIRPEAKDLFDDLADAMKMTALRAKQVHALYDYVDSYWSLGPQHQNHLADARKALADAEGVVAGREPRYRVPSARIAAWHDNSTAYEFGYLWTVHSLYYWKRDEGKVIDTPLLPCYRNIINPVDVAMGEGLGTDAARFFGNFLSTDQQRGCLAEPSSEPHF